MLMNAQIVFNYFTTLTHIQKEHFSKLESLYQDWNQKINVVSRKDIDELYLRHVLHSLGIAKIQQFNEGAQILDVGTGGGFPGIPLAILFPQTQFILVDAIGVIWCGCRMESYFILYFCAYAGSSRSPP